MKRIFRINKLILAFLLVIAPLNATENVSPEKVIELLKESDWALESWQKLQHKWFWSGKARQARISSRCHTLKDTQKELAMLLAQLSLGKQTMAYESYKATVDQSIVRIKKCAPPSFLRRNWVRYSAATLGLIGTTYALSKYGYDNKGKHLIENFYTNHIIEPTTNMYDILTKKNIDQTVLEQDADDALRRLQSSIDLFIENAKTDPELSKIVMNHIPPNTTIENVPLKQKLAFLDATITFMHTHVPTEIVESCKTLKIWNWGGFPHLKSFMDSHILLLQQVRVEKMYATTKVDMVDKKLNLTIELLAATPALVASYFCFKSVASCLSNYKANTTYKPLKKILIKLQLQYNQERYTTTPSLATQGMNIYWLSQLKDAIHSIPASDKISYCDYLKKLESNQLWPEQKITVIENMLRDVSFLQKV